MSLGRWRWRWLGWAILAFLAVAILPASCQTLLASEAYAMRHLRYSLRIRDFYWPKTRDPCLDWRGVLCENGRVVSIYLSGLKRTLVGMAQPTLALDNLQGLSALRLLNATGFVMLGTLPDWIGQLSTLQVLDFSSCSINGSVPSGIGQLGSLQRLSLARNNLMGGIPASVGNLSRLELLDLSANMLSGVLPPELGRMASLRDLDLSGNILSGPIPESLAVSSSSSLRSLRLSDNRLDGSVPENLTGWSTLQVLALGRNLLGGELPGALQGLRNLTLLDFSFNNFTGTIPLGLASLTSLQSLDLANNTFFGPLPAAVSSLRGLVVLNVSDNFLNDTVPAGTVAGAILSENCFTNVSGQRPFRDCQAFYAARGLVFQNASSFNMPMPMPTRRSKSKPRHLAVILGGTFGGLGLILLVAALVLLIRKHERQPAREPPKKSEEAMAGGAAAATAQGQAATTSGAGQFGGPPVAIAVKMSSIGESFTFSQLVRATQEFSTSNFIKAGHSGDLYRGVLDGGVLVVVKRIEVAKMKKDLLTEELEVFGKASHTRLVPLLGHCLDMDELKFLVYKYMPNGDLGQALHKKGVPSPPADILQSLDWITRLKIAIGVAEGLSYLHHECVPPLVHRDVQASSILLDDKFEVRLGSLSETRVQEGEAQPGLITRLLRLSQTTEQGDQGTAVASCAYDVYCFGKVLLELVTGKLDISGTSDPNADAWLEWALPLIDRHNKEGIMKLVDPSLIVDEDLLEEVWAMAIVAKLCLHGRASKRPQIRHVLKALENPQRVTREENFSSSLRSRTSSHSSWNASLFGSWRHSSSENVIASGVLREEFVGGGGGGGGGGGDPSRKHSGTSHSQGSITGEQSFHRRPGSSEIFPEPVEDPVKASSLGSGDNNGSSNNNSVKLRQQQFQQQQQQQQQV